MDLFFYTGRKDLAATTLADLQALITALADESKAANLATIARVTGKIDTLVQQDTGEPLNLYFYDDASTVSSWVTDSSVTLAIGLGYPDPTLASLFASTTSTSISGSKRTATLALNTTALADALYGNRGRGQFTLHIRKTASGITETVAMLPLCVVPGVLSAAPSTLNDTDYLTVSASRAAHPINASGITSLTGGGSTALDGLDAASESYPVGCILILSFDLVMQTWKLVAGTDAEDISATPAVVRPDTYDASTNAYVWKQIG